MMENIRKNRRMRDSELENIVDEVNILLYGEDLDPLIEDDNQDAMKGVTEKSVGNPDDEYEVFYADSREEPRSTTEVDSVMGPDDDYLQPDDAPQDPPLNDVQQTATPLRLPTDAAPPAERHAVDLTVDEPLSSNPTRKPARKQTVTTPKKPSNAATPAGFTALNSPRSGGKHKRTSNETDEDLLYTPSFAVKKSCREAPTPKVRKPRDTSNTARDRNKTMADFYERDERAKSLAFREPTENPFVICPVHLVTDCRTCPPTAPAA